MGTFSKSVIKRLAAQKAEKKSEETLAALKGAFEGNCNRLSCQAPGAIFYNKSTRKFYCEACAEAINVVNSVDAMRLYGVWKLCEPLPSLAEFQAVYERSGQGAVYDLANKRGCEGWTRCDPCDDHTPTRSGACGVCGTSRRGHYIGLDR